MPANRTSLTLALVAYAWYAGRETLIFSPSLLMESTLRMELLLQDLAVVKVSK
jgi:hypothetical protein